MKADVSAASGEGLAIIRACILKGVPPTISMLQAMPSRPRATTLVPLSKVKVVPGSGQAKSMVWAEAMAEGRRAVSRSEARQVFMRRIITKSDEMARRLRSAADRPQHGPVEFAAVLGDRAARVEGAAGRRVHRARQLA